MTDFRVDYNYNPAESRHEWIISNRAGTRQTASWIHENDLEPVSITFMLNGFLRAIQEELKNERS